MYNRKKKEWILVDVVRGGGSTRDDLRTKENRKIASYREMIIELKNKNPQYDITFVPLACTYNGAIAYDTWENWLRSLGLKDRDIEYVITKAIRAICIAFSRMVDIRTTAMRAHEDTE